MAETIGIETLKGRLDEIEKFYVAVGWFSSARYDEGTSVAKIAILQEFGDPASAIPPRPFIRPLIAKNKKKWSVIIGNLSKSILIGKDTVNSAMEKIGQLVAGELRKEISAVSDPPLSPVTIALRALKNREPHRIINKNTVNAVREAILRGETGKGQLGDQTFSNTRPLDDTGHMIATVNYQVGEDG